MNTCTHIPDISKCLFYESLNQKVLRQIMLLPDGLRKEIRLLAKQYVLIEFYKMPNDYSGNYIVREQPHILKYMNFDNEEEFEWRIEPENFK